MYIIIQVYSLLSEYDAGLGSHHSLMFVSKNAYPSLYTLSTGEVVHEFFVHKKKKMLIPPPPSWPNVSSPVFEYVYPQVFQYSNSLGLLFTPFS